MLIWHFNSIQHTRLLFMVKNGVNNDSRFSNMVRLSMSELEDVVLTSAG